MKVQVNARGKEWTVDVPEGLVARSVTYAMGVIAQRETAGMEEETEDARLLAIRERFARIEKGEWGSAGGRAADPVTRESVAILRSAAARKLAKVAYKPDVVPGSSDAKKVAAFMQAHFAPDVAARIQAKATKIARARAGDTI